MEVLILVLLIIFLISSVLFAPALALFPRIRLTPISANAIPFVSILILTAIARLLISLNLFNYDFMLLIAGGFLVVSILRLKRMTTFSQWSSFDKRILLLNVAIISPLFVSQALSAFSTADGLSSWNYWALHYYEQKIPESGVFYPQMYSIFLAVCYKLLGSFDTQGPVKALLAFFPLVLLNSIAFSMNKDKFLLVPYFLIALFSIFPSITVLPAFNYYLWGYADPMMASAYVSAIAFLLAYLRNRDGASLWLMVVCAVIASLSKQPGLILALFTIPLILLIDMSRSKRFDAKVFSAIWLVILPAVTWILSAKIGFYHNTAVVNRSMSGDVGLIGLFTTFFKSVFKYFILQPEILVLFILSIFSIKRDNHLRLIMWLSIMPGLIIWFLFGSYHFRLGLHVIGQMALLIAASNFMVFRGHDFFTKFNSSNSIRNLSWFFVVVAIAVFFVLLIKPRVLHKKWNIDGHHPVMDSYEIVLRSSFGDGADYIKKNIFENDVVVIAPNRMIAGALFGKANILLAASTPKELLTQISKTKASYIFDAGTTAQEPSRALRLIVKRNLDLFQEVPMPKASHGYKLYLIKH